MSANGVPSRDGPSGDGERTKPMSQDGKPGDDKPDGRARVSRISISLAEDLLGELDRMVGARGFANRSRAVSTILHRALTDHRQTVGDRVMVGTVTLFYNHLVPGLQQRLTDLQKRNIDEVISSLHVHLEASQTLEVLLVQGPARKLQTIADEMIAMKGVVSGHLQLAAALIPPLHPLADHAKAR